MQGDKNWILPKEINDTGSSETLIGWKSGKNTYVPLWDRMEGAWLWTLGYILYVKTRGSEYNQLCVVCVDLSLKGTVA